MNNSLMGISALDPTVAATDKFIKEKNIPPDQIEDFLLSMGADPRLAALVFKNRRLQQAAQNQQKGEAPATTVDQDVSNQYAQLKQQERAKRGISAIPAPNLARAPMQGGITGEPVKAMAGGGPVAFAGGGIASILRTILASPWGRRTILGAGIAGGTAAALNDDVPQAAPAEQAKVEEIADLTPEQLAALAEMDKAAPAASAPTPFSMPNGPRFQGADLSKLQEAITAAEKDVPASEEAAFEKGMQKVRDLGMFKGVETRRAALKEQKEKTTTSPEKKFWLSFAQAGFAASAKGARNLWETLSMGGVEGMKAYQTMKDKEAETLERIADKELQLGEMENAVKLGVMDRSSREYREKTKDLRDLRLQHAAQSNANRLAETQFGLQKYSIDTQAALAQLNRQEKAALEGLQRQYQQDALAESRERDPAKKAALQARMQVTLQRATALAKTDPSVIRALMMQEMQMQGIRTGNTGGASAAAPAVNDGFGEVTAE